MNATIMDKTMNSMMATTMINTVRENLETTAEEIRTVNRGLKARAAAAVRFIFSGNDDKPFGLDLSPAMQARLYL